VVELISAPAAGAAWIALFLLLTHLARGTSVFGARGDTCVGRAGAWAPAVLVAYPLFFFLQVVVAKALGWAGALSAIPLWIAYGVVLALLGAAALRRSRRAEPGDRESADASSRGPDESRPAAPSVRGGPSALPDRTADPRSSALLRRLVLGAAGLTVAALALYALVTPPHVWDVQAYHMPIVGQHVQGESLGPWAAQDLRQLYRVKGGELQMTTLAVLAGTDAWVELPNVVALLVALVAAFHLAREVLGRDDHAWLATAFVLTAPQILLGSVTAKNDLIFMALTLTAFYWTVRVAKEPETAPTRRALLLGLLGGLAVATKVMGLNVLGAVGLALLVLAALGGVRWRVPALVGVAAVVVGSALVGDVYGQNWSRSGGLPVGTMPGEVRFDFGLSNLVAAARVYLYDISFARLVRVQRMEHDFSHYGYFFPFLLLVGAYVAVRALVARVRAGRAAVSGAAGTASGAAGAASGAAGAASGSGADASGSGGHAADSAVNASDSDANARRREFERHRLAAATLALLAGGLFFSVVLVREAIQWDQRFMIWMVPTFAVLATAAVPRLAPRGTLLIGAFVVGFAVHGLFRVYTDASSGLFVRSAKHLASAGVPARLVDVPPEGYRHKIDGFAALDARAAPTDSVLYVGAEDSWMYPAWGRRFTRHVEGVAGPADVAGRIAARSYRFLVVEDASDAGLRATALEAARRAGYGTLLDAEGRTLLERGGAGR